MRTPSENKKAVPGATGTALKTAHNADSTAKNQDVITILRANHCVVPYANERGGVNSTSVVRITAVDQVAVSGLDDVEQVFAELKDDSQACVVRGSFVGVNKAKRRNKHPDCFDSCSENFIDAPSRILHIQVAANTREPEPERAVREAIKLLPDAFHDVSFLWKLERRGAMNTGGLRARLTFWLDQPKSLKDVKQLLGKLTWCVGKETYSPVSLIQTGKPIGLEDTAEGHVQGGSDVVRLAGHCPQQGGRDPISCVETEDFVTVLQTYGPTLTKTFKADGKIDSYGDAASFAFTEQPIADIHALSRLLTKLQDNAQRCIIRGKFAGEDKAEKGKVEGSWARTNTSFDDCLHHWFMVDIDNFKPGFDDPVLDPVNSIKDFLSQFLPKCFENVSFHWQLSSSAGTKGKEDQLKAHVWFWSDVSYTSAQMYAWAKDAAPRIDKAVYRRVQIHYCAGPIFEEAERRIRLQLVLEIASCVSRPSGLLAALKFCGGDGGLTKNEIKHVLVELPGRALRLDDNDSDGCFVDLALERLTDLGYPTTATKGPRLTPSGDIRDYLVYRLAEGNSNETVR